MNLTAVVLAAGKGTRMKSELPKPLHEVRGRPLLGWVVRSLDAVTPSAIALVVGHGREQVVESMSRNFGDREFLYAEQKAQRGTGDAAAVGLAELDLHDGGFSEDEHVLVLPGDTPLVRPDTIAALVHAHIESEAACTLVTSLIDNPTGYGRVIRDNAGSITAIVEERDADADHRAIHEINAGMYCVRRSLLSPALRMIESDNAQGELYLTDVIGVLAQAGHKVVPFPADQHEIGGVNDRAQLGMASQALAQRIADRHMRNGVTLVNPAATVIDAEVDISPDVIVHTGTTIEGRTRIESGAVIGPNSHLVDAEIGERAVVHSSVVRGASVEADASVGPFAVLDRNQ